MAATGSIVVLAILTATATATAQANERRSESDGELPNPLAEVYFPSDSATIGADDRRALGAVADWMRRHPTRILIVEGHADPDEREATWLSEQRMDSVRDELVRLGVDPVRIASAAFSDEEATADPAANRRVAVTGTLRPFGGR